MMNMHTMGHNNPPSADDWLEDVCSLEASLQKWSGVTLDENNVVTLKSDIDLGRTLAKDIESARKVAKQPFLDEAKAVDEGYKPLGVRVEGAVGQLRRILSDFLAELERKRRDEEERARREAEEAAKRAAELEDDPLLGESAMEEAAQAELDAVVAARETKVQVTDGSGRTMSLRSRWVGEIEDAIKLVHHYADHPDVIELCLKKANQDIRSRKGQIEIPGVRVVEKREAV